MINLEKREVRSHNKVR